MISRRLLILLVAVVATFNGTTRVEAQPLAKRKAIQGEHSAAWVVYAGTLIDGVSDATRTKVSILVRDGRIERVANGFIPVPKGHRLADLRDHTVLPGLMDMHTHLTLELSKDSYSEQFFMDPADFALRAAEHARRTLLAGVTTVRDLGDRHDVSVSLRKAIAKGWVIGPRIFTSAKSLATTGGHADPTNGLNAKLRGDPGPRDGVVNGADDARKAVRQRYKDGADLIKLTATGGVLSLAKSGQNPQFTAAELEAIVATARDYGFTVAVHAHGAEGMKRAVLAGVDSIEHGTLMNDEVVALMKERGTYYVPTLSAGKWVLMKAREDADFLPAVVKPKAAALGPMIQNTFTKVYRAGIKIAFGTDSGVSPHGDNARELLYMVEAGMKPMDALKSATIEAATLLRQQAKLGSIEPSKAADIIAVAGDPLRDMKVMLDIRFVMKEGVVYKRPPE